MKPRAFEAEVPEPLSVGTSRATRLDANADGGGKPKLAIPDHEPLRRIGEGAYGEVWLARNVLGGYRAVKVIYRMSFRDERAYEREFHGIQRFEPISRSNDGLLDILQAGRNDEEGYYYYVMELADAVPASVRGETNHYVEQRLSPLDYRPRTFDSELKERGRIPGDECVQFGLTLTLALGFLHRNGLIHRDIKPANIIFVKGIPKLADIGLVTAFDETCSFVGTEGYIAPEGPTSPRADLYSLGKVLYELSTGKDRKEFPDPATGFGETGGSEAQAELNAIILKACAPDPRQRYESAEEFHADLALLNSGKSVKSRRVVERRLALAKKTIAIAATVTALTTTAFLFQRHQTRRVERNLYIANMNLAQRDWDKANINRLSRLLEETENDPEKGFEWHFWNRQLHLDLQTLRGHTGAVTSVAFSPDGQKLATAGEDRTVRIWDVSTGDRVLLIQGHRGSIVSVAYSPNGERILTGSLDGTVRVWGASTGEGLVHLNAPGTSVYATTFSPNGRRIGTVSRDATTGRLQVAIWDAATGEKLRVLGDGAGRHGLSAVAFSPDGSRLAAIAHQHRVTLWDLESGEELFACKPHSEAGSVAFSPDGERLLTGSGRIAVWEISSGRELRTLEKGNEFGLIQVAYAPDGRTMASAGKDQRLILWDAESGKELFRLAGHGSSIRAVAFSPDGRRVATASEDSTAKIWDASGSPNPRILATRSKQAHTLALSPDGKRVATSAWDKSLRIADLASGRELLVLTGLVNEVTSAAFSPSGKHISTAFRAYQTPNHDNAKILDAATGEEVRALKGHSFAVFAPDGRSIATASGARAAILWNTTSGEEIIVLGGHTDWVQAGGFSPDGRRIATASRDRTIRLWDTATGREIRSIPLAKPESDFTWTLSFSPDGKSIARAGSDRTPGIWDSKSGKKRLELHGHTGAVASIGWSPDSQRVVTSSADRTVKLWDAQTGRELLTLEGYARNVPSAAFARDGRSIVTVDYDGITKVWEGRSVPPTANWRGDEPK